MQLQDQQLPTPLGNLLEVLGPAPSQSKNPYRPTRQASCPAPDLPGSSNIQSSNGQPAVPVSEAVASGMPRLGSAPGVRAEPLASSAAAGAQPLQGLANSSACYRRPSPGSRWHWGRLQPAWCTRRKRENRAPDKLVCVRRLTAYCCCRGLFMPSGLGCWCCWSW